MSSPPGPAAVPSHLQERWHAFARERQMLEAYVRCLVRDPTEAEDVFQEVGLVVLEHPTGPDDPARFAAWCRGIARNLVMRRWEAGKRTVAVGNELLELVDRSFDEQDGSGELWARRRAALDRCLETLGAADRWLFRARYVEGLDAETIGAQMGRGGDAVRQKLRRVREALWRCVGRRLAEGGGA